MEHKIVPAHSASVAILRRRTEAHLTTILTHEPLMDERNLHATILIAKRITIRAEIESLVHVVKSKCDRMAIEKIQTAWPTQQILLKRRMHEVLENVLIQMLVTSFPNKNIVLH